MANTIAKAFVQQFQDNLIHLASQKGSRLRSSVTEQSVTGEKFNFERLVMLRLSLSQAVTLIRQCLKFHTLAELRP